jgi:tetratricopeptide (TPR) repeat protein
MRVHFLRYINKAHTVQVQTVRRNGPEWSTYSAPSAWLDALPPKAAFMGAQFKLALPRHGLIIIHPTQQNYSLSSFLNQNKATYFMRLLHFDALSRLVLTDFRGKRIPPYAILSHRWSDSEILIEDITSEMYKEKEEGYKKLMFCAGQAAQDELQYFWIDTCCIDRWNNNERSRAINSMFQWYKNATRCYVFLSDVSVSTATELVQRSDWEASFRASAWFTRGWTLQELIAPVLVEFFSREGLRIGDKTSLDQLLHTITSIPLAALRNCPLNQFSTSERMRWAENRVTTEEEDRVYCLLGLLSVSMPATYGEGQESALERLQAEIQGVSSAPSIIPFSRNKSFVGREPQLAELEAKLFSNKQSTTTLAIVGPGGTGKSQLALEVAHRARQYNTDCAVFWIDASHKDSLYQSYASVAQKLSIPGWNDSDLADMKQVIKHCVAELRERQCLLVFDNVDDITLLSGSSSTVDATGLADYLPQSTRCSVIFTTTSTKVAETLAPQNVIALHELTADTALRMLQNSLSRPLSPMEQQQSVLLLRELLYLPIAIVHAAACMSASEMTVQEYATQLDKHKSVVHEYNNDLLEHRPQNCGLGSPIAATLSLSISQVRHRNAIAADYLSLTACVDRKDIVLDLLEASSLQAREESIKVLDKYALITRRPAESALDVHRLVHDALRARLQAKGQLQHWTQRVITQLVQVFPNGDHSNRSKWRRLFPHALYALSHSQTDNNDKKRLDLVWKCAMSLYKDGRYKEAEELFVQVMQTNKRALGDEHPDTLSSMANLAATYRKQGHWGKAEELEVQVMQTFKRVLGDEHLDTLTSMGNLASTYRNQGHWGKAEELFVQVMQTSKRVLGDEHPDTLSSMANLAATYRKQGHWGKAEELEVQVMQTFKRVLGDEHPDTLSSMANLASTYWNQGHWARPKS